MGGCCPYIKPAALPAQALCSLPAPCGCHCCHQHTEGPGQSHSEAAPSTALGETPSLGRGGTAPRNLCLAKPGKENKQPTPTLFQREKQPLKGGLFKNKAGSSSASRSKSAALETFLIYFHKRTSHAAAGAYKLFC